MKLVCPHCEEKISQNVSRCKNNCEQYGNTTFILECEHCGKNYKLSFEKIIKIRSIEKTECNYTDY